MKYNPFWTISCRVWQVEIPINKLQKFGEVLYSPKI
jgi:hypothetical protein